MLVRGRLQSSDLEQKSKAAKDTSSNGKQAISLTKLQSSSTASRATAASSLRSTTTTTKTAEHSLASRVCGLASNAASL